MAQVHHYIYWGAIMLNRVEIFVSLFLGLVFSLNVYAVDRVPYVFTGDSKAPAYQDYSSYKKKKDSRDSTKYAGYYLNYDRINKIAKKRGISKVHYHVRDIAKDGLCKGTCFRILIYLNGGPQDGEHVATFVVSPGTGTRTPTVSNAQLRRYTRTLYKYESPTQYSNFDMYRIYGSKSYPGSIPNMPNVQFFMDAIGIHGSFDKVDGNKRSHGCIRMFPDESYFAYSLTMAAGGNAYFDVVHTR